MNREILFRGKRIDNGEWVEGYLWVGNDYTYITPRNVGISYDDKLKHIVAFANEVDPETICQYTGLTDKNGRKIFEGDVVQDYPFKAVVRFGEFESQVLKNIGFNLDWLNKHYYRQDLPYWAEKIEVIGSIFDNLNLGCMTELPCSCKKELDGIEYCIKAEGDCEYQILDGGGDNVGRLIEKDSSRWQLKNVPWEALGEGKIITRDVSEKIYGALCKLKDYEDTEKAPDEIELLKYHNDERIINDGLKMTLKRKIKELKGSSDYPHNFKGQMVEDFEWVLSLMK